MRKDVETLFAAGASSEEVRKHLGIAQFDSAQIHANKTFPGSNVHLNLEDFKQLNSAYKKANEALFRQLADGKIKNITITSEMVLRELAFAYNSEIRKV